MTEDDHTFIPGPPISEATIETHSINDKVAIVITKKCSQTIEVVTLIFSPDDARDIGRDLYAAAEASEKRCRR